MDELFTLGQLARHCGAPPETIRDLVRRRKLPGESRRIGNYRVWSKQSADAAKAIVARDAPQKVAAAI